ncbi:putative integral membrane protein [Brugia pahangi]
MENEKEEAIGLFTNKFLASYFVEFLIFLTSHFAELTVEKLKKDGAKFSICKIYLTFQSTCPFEYDGPSINLSSYHIINISCWIGLIYFVPSFFFFVSIESEPSDISSDNDEVESEHSEDEK